MATERCFELYERVVVSSLAPPHKRVDPKLTPTEKERLAITLKRIWELIPIYKNSEQEAYDDLSKLSTKDVYLTRETIVFLFSFVQEDELLEVMRLQYGNEAAWNEIGRKEGLHKLLRWGNELLTKRNVRAGLPPKPPLSLFGIFDHWQRDYVEEIREEHRVFDCFDRQRGHFDPVSKPYTWRDGGSVHGH